MIRPTLKSVGSYNILYEEVLSKYSQLEIELFRSVIATEDPKGHGHPTLSDMNITYADYENLQSLRLALRPCRQEFIYKLEKYLPH